MTWLGGAGHRKPRPDWEFDSMSKHGDKTMQIIWESEYEALYDAINMRDDEIAHLRKMLDIYRALAAEQDAAA